MKMRDIAGQTKGEKKSLTTTLVAEMGATDTRDMVAAVCKFHEPLNKGEHRCGEVDV